MTSPRESALFIEALKLPATDRGAFLDHACAGDAVLRQRLDVLLQAHVEAGDFLEPSVDAGGHPAFAAGFTGEKPGDWIGRYKLLEQIGEGGCGVVYMAEQVEPVRRRVALKIIKPGMDTRAVIARFEAERQALALMDHPHIAKVFDAGATESGRPYFVMELVRGIKITHYCDEHSLSTEDRLKLFIQVCQAVQHAHQKGVIHRDLKPSNILVTTAESGAPSPVVIDFGIAKATTNQRLTDKTLFTAFEMLIGTPAYMSPEQAAVTGVDVDTRTDIYSLGVLLYELLTGTTPFDAGELLKAGLDEVRRVIREQNPVRPSARLSQMTHEQQTAIAHHRQSEPPGLIRAMSGDLDWIAMKALEKDRARRYETANGLTMDVQRFLTDETVSARPPSAGYRLRKTVRRHKLLFASASIVALLLVVSLTTIAVSLARERRARLEADAARIRSQTDAVKSRQVTRFLEEMLQGVGPSVALGRDTVMLREILDKAAARIEQDLASQPMVRAEMQAEIGNIYEQLAVFPQAESLLRAALATYRKVLGDRDPQVPKTLDELALVFAENGRLVDAEGHYREALALRQAAPIEDNAAVAHTMAALGEVLRRQHKLQEAEAMLLQALAIQLHVLGNENLEVAETLCSLGRVRTEGYRLAEADEMQREALAIRRRLLGDEHPLVAASLNLLGMNALNMGSTTEARTRLTQALALQIKLYGERHPEVAACYSRLGRVAVEEANFTEAEVYLRKALSIQRSTLGEMNLLTFVTLEKLGVTLDALGHAAEAEALDRRGLAQSRALLGDEHPQTARFLMGLDLILTKQGRYADIEQLYAELLTPELLARPGCADLLLQRAAHWATRSRWKEAAADARKAVEYRPNSHEHYHVLALVLVEDRDLIAYQQLCQTIVDHFGRTNEPVIAERMVKDCLLLPGNEAYLPTFEAMIDRAIEKGEHMGMHPFILACRALVEYRLGHLEHSLAAADEAGQNSPPEGVQGMCYPILAMVHHRLNHPAMARDYLQKDAVLVQKFWPPSDNLGPNWQTWVFSHALLNEATGLIGPAPAGEGSSDRRHVSASTIPSTP